MDLMYLICECGSQDFLVWNKLKTTQAGGVVSEIGGWRCGRCLEKTDVGHLVRRVEIARKEAELQQLNAEIADAKAIRPPAQAGKAAEEPELRNVPPGTNRMGD